MEFSQKLSEDVIRYRILCFKESRKLKVLHGTLRKYVSFLIYSVNNFQKYTRKVFFLEEIIEIMLSSYLIEK